MKCIFGVAIVGFLVFAGCNAKSRATNTDTGGDTALTGGIVTVGSDSETMRSDSGTAGGDSETMSSDSEPLGSDSATLSDDSETADSDSESLSSDSAMISSDSAAGDSDTEDTVNDTADTANDTGTAQMHSDSDTVIVPHECTSTPFRMINYYPEENAWLDMWREWSAVKPAMDDDMQRIADMGANAVRFFVHPQLFGMENGDHQPSEAQIAMLDDALDIMTAHGLKGVPTLFDLWGDMNMIDASKEWLAGLMSAFKNDARIAMWQLKNEVDLTKSDQLNWTTAVFPLFRELAGDTPVALSISATKKYPQWRTSLETMVSVVQPDYYDVHWYTGGEVIWTGSLRSDLQDAISIVGNPNCIILGEVGQTTGDFFAAESQNDVFEQVFYFSNALGIRHYGLWTLWDFPEGTQMGDGVTADINELNYGMYQLDGTPKPTMSTVRQMFNGTPPGPPVFELPNKSFEAVDYRTMNLEGWRPWAHPDVSIGNIAIDSTVAHSGDASVKVTVDQTLLGGVSTVYGIYSVPAMPVDAAHAYTLDCWARVGALPVDNDSFAQIVVSWFAWEGTGDATWIGQSESPAVYGAAADTWTQMTLSSTTPPANAAFAQIFLQVRATTAGVSVWFDDITLNVDSAP